MPIKVGVIMDSLSQIKRQKDSTVAMMLEAQKRSWEIFYIEPHQLFLEANSVYAEAQKIALDESTHPWYTFIDPLKRLALQEFDVILMRKDPPFDMQYVFMTYLLELAEQQGAWIINNPRSLRDANEKLFTAWFTQCCAATMVARDPQKLLAFFQQHHDVIFKPLFGMGGMGVFRVKPNDPNVNVILETLTHNGSEFIMAQRYIPEIKETGDKRVLVINGEPVPYALARIPSEGETRGNLATGGKGLAVALTERDYWICQQVAPVLKEKGLIFVGLDIIGDYLTEINVTSPTCIRELDQQCGLNISALLMDYIEQTLHTRKKS
ncbi:MAG: glutathione synthase [Gammaproteobacteria bacterium]